MIITPPPPPRPSSSSCCLKYDNTMHLRIISTNDVYELNNWSKAKTAIDFYKNNAPNPNNSIFILAGDFLSPSLLSSIDNGKSMVDIMNNCGVDYVCFGNHEADISIDELNKRIEESNFIWINTNINNLPIYDNNKNKVKTHIVLNMKINKDIIITTKSSSSSSSLVVVEEKGKGGEEEKIIKDNNIININSVSRYDHHDDEYNNSNDVYKISSSYTIIKKVYLLGLLTDDKSLYKDNVFGGAIIKPIGNTIIEYINNSIINNNNDNSNDDNSNDDNSNDDDDDNDDYDYDIISIIPITHQSIKYDRELGKILYKNYYNKRLTNNNNNNKMVQVEIPLIIGGHDHDAYIEDINNDIRIAKAGCDIENILIFDLSWKYNNNDNNNNMKLDDIFINLVSVKDFKPDPNIELLIEKHNKKLDDNNNNNISTSLLPPRISNYYKLLLPIRYSILCDNIDITRLFKNSNKIISSSSSSSTTGDFNNDNILLLSSKNIRLHQTTIGTFIASSIRDGMSIYNIIKIIQYNNNNMIVDDVDVDDDVVVVVDCCIFPSGAIRRGYLYHSSNDNHINTKYDKDANFNNNNNTYTFTYNDLKSEITYNDDIIIIPIPGLILRDSVKYSRRNSKGTGGYFQLCDNIKVDNNDPSIIISINNKPLDLNKYYNVAIPLVTLQGLDNNEILTSWYIKEQEPKQKGEEIGRYSKIDKIVKLPAKPAIIIFYSIIRWASINLLSTSNSSSSSLARHHPHCCCSFNGNNISFISAADLANIANIESVTSHAFYNFLIVGGLNPIPNMEVNNNDEMNYNVEDLKYKWYFNIHDILKAKCRAYYYLSHLKKQQEEAEDGKVFIGYSKTQPPFLSSINMKRDHYCNDKQYNDKSHNPNNNYTCCCCCYACLADKYLVLYNKLGEEEGIDNNEWSSHLII